MYTFDVPERRLSPPNRAKWDNPNEHEQRRRAIASEEADSNAQPFREWLADRSGFDDHDELREAACAIGRCELGADERFCKAWATVRDTYIAVRMEDGDVYEAVSLEMRNEYEDKGDGE